MLYWLYQREDTGKARSFANRLEKLLPKVTPDHEGIFGEECWSLLYEAKGDLSKAIDHREKEIRLFRLLHEISRNTYHEELILKRYGYGDLSDRLELLAILYHDNGNLDKAISTLHESTQVCEMHGIKFDGEDILQGYREEITAMHASAS